MTPPIEPIDPRPVEKLSPNIIRQIFNSEEYFEKINSVEIYTCISKNSHLENPRPPDPYCTHSQILYYYSQEPRLVAIVHQYQRPDGSLGQSGLPDPKKVFLPERIIQLRKEEEQD